MGLGYVVEAEAFGGFGFNADLIEFHAEQIRDADAHFSGYRRDFGCGQDERGVHVDDAVTGVLDLFEREVEEDGGVGVFPARVVGREEGADVAGSDGAEQGVGDGVQEYVAV